jgi:hypothetical protein
MNEEPVNTALMATVSLVIDQLDLYELSSVYIATVLGYKDPTGTAGYDKARPLFSEDEGRAMHEETKRYFLALANERLEEERGQ